MAPISTSGPVKSLAELGLEPEPVVWNIEDFDDETQDLLRTAKRFEEINHLAPPIETLADLDKVHAAMHAMTDDEWDGEPGWLLRIAMCRVPASVEVEHQARAAARRAAKRAAQKIRAKTFNRRQSKQQKRRVRAAKFL